MTRFKACSWLVVANCFLSPITVPAAAYAEAGISEAARAQACWLKRPYALLKSGDKDIGPDTVSLILGRDATSDDWLPYEGNITTVKTLVQDVARTAVTPKYLLMELSGNRGYAAIDLDATKAEALIFPDQTQLLKALGGRIGTAKLSYRTFEDWHREKVEVPARNRGLLLGSIALALVVLVPATRRVFEWRMSVRNWLILIAVLYVAALFTPAVAGSLGILCLILAPFTIVFLPTWLANPLLWFGCHMLKTRRGYSAFGLSVLAALCAASFAFWGRDSLQVGYWLWLSSTIGLVAAADDHRVRDRKPKPSKAELAGILEGLEDMRAGRGRPACDVFDEIRRGLKIPTAE